MNARIGRHHFGESNIEFLAVDRSKPQHSVRQFKVSVEFTGEFEDVYVRGNNSELLPSSAVNNMALDFAQRYITAEPEHYVAALAERLRAACPAVRTVETTVEVSGFEPLRMSGGDSHTGFTPCGQEGQTATARIDREGRISLSGGLRGLQLFMTTGSVFKGFLRDKYTTTPDFEDRALGMKVDVQWFPESTDIDFAGCRHRARQAILDAFAGHVSLSSEHTCYLLGEAVLAACPDVSWSAVSGVHQTRRLADMTAYGCDNPGQIYLVDDTQATTLTAEVFRPGPTE